MGGELARMPVVEIVTQSQKESWRQTDGEMEGRWEAQRHTNAEAEEWGKRDYWTVIWEN